MFKTNPEAAGISIEWTAFRTDDEPIDFETRLKDAKILVLQTWENRQQKFDRDLRAAVAKQRALDGVQEAD